MKRYMRYHLYGRFGGIGGASRQEAPPTMRNLKSPLLYYWVVQHSHRSFQIYIKKVRITVVLRLPFLQTDYSTADTGIQ